MKYYNFCTGDCKTKDLLKDFLIDNNIYFEMSGVDPHTWHFEILTDTAGADAINKFIAEGGDRMYLILLILLPVLIILSAIK